MLNQIKGLLRGDDAADGVAAREHNAAMIHHCVGRRCVGRHCMLQIFGRGLWQEKTLYKRATAGGAPVGFGFSAEHGAALAADTFH
jgi:hypothetical protein